MRPQPSGAGAGSAQRGPRGRPSPAVAAERRTQHQQFHVFDADERRTSQPQTRTKIRWSRRRDMGDHHGLPLTRGASLQLTRRQTSGTPETRTGVPRTPLDLVATAGCSLRPAACPPTTGMYRRNYRFPVFVPCSDRGTPSESGGDTPAADIQRLRAAAVKTARPLPMDLLRMSMANPGWAARAGGRREQASPETSRKAAAECAEQRRPECQKEDQPAR